MRSRSISVLLAAAWLGLWPGCRCGSSSPPEPPPAASSRPAGPIACPTAQPDWAGDPPEPDLLLAELLMQPELDSSRKGTGIRIYNDGRVFAYDEAIFDFKNGKMTNRPIVGKWRQHRSVAPERVAELRSLIASLPRDELTHFQGKNRTGTGRPSFLRVRSGDTSLRSCYRGLEGGDAQRKVDALVKTLMGEAHDPSVNEK